MNAVIVSGDGSLTTRFLLRRFPYGVFYGLEQGRIVIVAVIHAHRHPDHWFVALEDRPDR